MTADDPSERQSAAEALAKFNSLVASLPEEYLAAPVPDPDEVHQAYFDMRVRRGWQDAS